MPIHEYSCYSCGHKFEYLILRESDCPEKCESCGGNDLRRLMSVCGFVSRGGDEGHSGGSSNVSCGHCSASSCAGCS